MRWLLVLLFITLLSAVPMVLLTLGGAVAPSPINTTAAAAAAAAAVAVEEAEENEGEAVLPTASSAPLWQGELPIVTVISGECKGTSHH
jgi:hypothetical protein